MPADLLTCVDVSPQLAEASEGVPVLDADARAHVEHCLRCQAEIVQYRKLLRAMRALRTDVLEPDPGLLLDVLAAVGEAGERHALRSLLSGRRAAYLGGLAAAATAAGVGGVIVLARRRSRQLAA